VILDEMEAALTARLKALPPAARAELLHVLMLPDFKRADRIGEFWSYPASPDLRRAADRLRGGSDAEGCVGRDAAGKLTEPSDPLPHGMASRLRRIQDVLKSWPDQRLPVDRTKEPAIDEPPAGR
jgi:hypothetical protein